MPTDFDILVIGAGQAGLSAGYHLQRLGLRPERHFLLVDRSPGPGGAWQFRWPSLTLDTVNRVHDLPGMSFAETLPPGSSSAPAASAVPHYYELYEKRFDLRVHRRVSVTVVCDRTEEGDPADRGAVLGAETDASGLIRVRGLINCTGTWENPFVPHYPGAQTFTGRQLHTHDYHSAAEFAGKHVVVVGGGISAVQLLDEISQVTTTTWVTRTPPRFREGPFTEEAGRAAVAMVEDRVRRGLPPGSVVSVTGLRLDDRLRAARDRGALTRLPMFERIEPGGVRWADGTFQQADVILWATGFRSALDHLAPLRLRGPGGGITMSGRLATQVAADPRIHLIGYGPSASTVGANRAGRTAALELTRHLGLR
ncbi:NAD(P)-binding domain-containing protein [Nocardia gamkensis]|uniref:NAD(P)/FAD-dependent oxidoreductase n=1 Tax=Nocardia gamkensis TaxID=352869 RepID=A0A7X6L0N8_9NOCA|nr:NAD(P)-binding domain-containing protein [Nocardia gamkensis]NKY25694.1 NAD(P)/FAD-dependent oxidoreductase [Nocardia gamkensis]NQE66445.1 Flavin-containing monooxygenase FMO GS-OX2 [Nocardia gamkensis]